MTENERNFVENRIRDLTRQRDEARTFLEAVVAAYGELRVPQEFFVDNWVIEGGMDPMTNEYVLKKLRKA